MRFITSPRVTRHNLSRSLTSITSISISILYTFPPPGGLPLHSQKPCIGPTSSSVRFSSPSICIPRFLQSNLPLRNVGSSNTLPSDRLIVAPGLPDSLINYPMRVESSALNYFSQSSDCAGRTRNRKRGIIAAWEY